MSEIYPPWQPPHTWTIPELPEVERVRQEGESVAVDGAAFRAIREALGLSAADVATWLQVAPRTVQRWDTHGLPDWAVGEVDALVRHTRDWVDRLTVGAEAIIHQSTMSGGRQTAGWRILPDGRILPESWWITTVGRAAMSNPSLAVDWGQ